jgi:peptidyl-prolyl cis-trans isomerase A (cyclophilin A)
MENFATMKSLYLLCAFSLFAAVMAARADDTNSTPAAAAPAATASPGFDDPSKLTATAPDTFKAQFNTTKGKIVIEVTRSQSPNGADRFYNLVKSGYFTDIAFFRVVSGFMVQFGIHGDPAVSAKWRGAGANIQDDPVKGSNTRGTITYAMSSAPNSRSVQFFINFGDNSRLDGMGFASFGKVVEGMDVVDKINGEYGDMPQQGGNGPNPDHIEMEGNAYLKKDFPNLDYIKSATILPADDKK